MSTILLLGLTPLAIMFLEIILTEIFGDHLVESLNTWEMRFDAEAWHALEVKMCAISGVIVGVATYYVIYHPIEASTFWRTIGMIFGTFGYLIYPVYIRRIGWNKCVFC